MADLSRNVCEKINKPTDYLVSHGLLDDQGHAVHTGVEELPGQSPRYMQRSEGKNAGQISVERSNFTESE